MECNHETVETEGQRLISDAIPLHTSYFISVISLSPVRDNKFKYRIRWNFSYRDKKRLPYDMRQISASVILEC